MALVRTKKHMRGVRMESTVVEQKGKNIQHQVFAGRYRPNY